MSELEKDASNGASNDVQPVFGTMADVVEHVTERYGRAGIRLGAEGADTDIIMTPGAYARFMEGEMGIGESFQDNLCREGSMTIREFTMKRIRGRLMEPPRKTKGYQQDLEHSPIVAREHYDIGNDYFRAMLDPYMQYSCGWYYKGAQNLAEAQEAKLLGTGTKQRLSAGDTVLDIGCGFGGLLRFYHERWNTRGVGTTLSQEQADFARESNKGLPNEFLVRDYRNLEGQFDHIVSVGMFEHVGPEHYEEFFDACVRLLKPGGDVLLHSIFGGGMDPWLEANIFRGGELPTKPQVENAIKGRFIAMDWHWFGRDYDPTAMAWNANMKAARETLRGEKYDDRFFRTQDYYQQACAGRFASRIITAGQVHLFKEPTDGYQMVR